jgi:CRP-like cAMP-binding protein
MTVNAGQVLRSLPTFAPWSTEAINGLLLRARKVRFFQGDILFREGEPGNSLFVVLEGQIMVSLQAGDRAVELSREGPGAILGEMALIDPGPRSATATALTAGTTLGLSAAELGALQSEDPALASALLRAFTRVLASRVRDADTRIAAMAEGWPSEQSAVVWRTLWLTG